MSDQNLKDIISLIKHVYLPPYRNTDHCTTVSVKYQLPTLKTLKFTGEMYEK